MTKKKLIKVEGYDGPTYTSKSIGFAFVTPPTKGRKQINSFNTCRDFLHDIVRAYLHQDYPNARSGYWAKGKSEDIDMDRTRLLINRKCDNDNELKEWKEKLFSAKRLLNIYEDMAKFSKLSKITTVAHSSTDNCWLLTGPKEWMMAPQALSMVTLILRTVSCNKVAKVNTMADVDKFWSNLLGRKADSMDLTYYIPECYDKFEMIARKFNEIFNQDPKDAYGRDYTNFHDGGGIVALCAGKTGNTHLANNFTSEWKKWKEGKR